MIEIGTVKSHNKTNGTITVDFAHINTSADCHVLQSTTGDNTIFILPSIGTQVVCWLENGKNIALGAVFSDDDKPPTDTSENGILYNIGKTKFGIDNEKVTFENSSMSLLKLFEEVLNTIKSLQIVTPQGAGQFEPASTEAAITKFKTQLKQR